MIADRASRAEVAFPAATRCMRRARIGGSRCSTIRRRARDVHDLLSRCGRPLRGCAAARADRHRLRDAQSPPLWDIVRDVNAFQQRDGAADLPRSRRSTGRRPPRPRMRPIPCVAGFCGTTSRRPSSCSKTVPGSPGASGSRPAASRACSSRRTRAACARSSRARSRSLRPTARWNADSRTARSRARRCSRRGPSRASARRRLPRIERGGAAEAPSLTTERVARATSARLPGPRDRDAAAWAAPSR